MWRKTILASALVGAGLTSTAGAAFAGEAAHEGHDKDSSHHGDHDKSSGDHHDHGKADNRGCSNEVDADNGGPTYQQGVINVDDLQTIVPANVCGNNVPVNVLGVQVPIQDSDVNLPILSPSEDDSSNSARSEG